MRRLSTFDGIIKALGGIPATARLAECSTQAVWNWRARGFFPTVLWFVVLEELEANDYTTEARWLFRFKEKSSARRRDAA